MNGKATGVRNEWPLGGRSQRRPRSERARYLGLPAAEYVDHDLHHRLVHPEGPHEIGMLVEHLIVHDVPGEDSASVSEAEGCREI